MIGSLPALMLLGLSEYHLELVRLSVRALGGEIAILTPEVSTRRPGTTNPGVLSGYLAVVNPSTHCGG